MIPKWLTNLALIGATKKFGVLGGLAGTAALALYDNLSQKEEPIYTTKDVADLLNISEYTVRKKIRDGELRAETIPGKAGYRITQSALDDYKNRKNKFVQPDNSIYNVANFSNFINTFANEDTAKSNNDINPELLDTLIEGKKLDIEACTLALKKLDLSDIDSNELEQQRLSLQIVIKNLEAEIKAYEFIKKSLAENPNKI